MVEAGTGSIFLVTNTSDTEAIAKTASNIIEFNGTGLSPDDRTNVKTMSIHYIEDLSLHPNPNRHLTQIQAGKLGTVEVIITGTFVNPDLAGAIAELQSWMNGDKTNSAFPFGRFGIRYDKMTQIELLPTATVGYILYDCYIEDVEEFEAKADFILKFYRNGTA